MNLCVVLFAYSTLALPRWLIDVQIELNARSRGCSTVALTVALFPHETFARGRPTGMHELHLPHIVSEAHGCAFAVVTERVRAVNELRVDWNLLTIDCVDCTSNERQRRAHALKTFAPLLFPQAVQIHYGDVKCRLSSNQFPYAQFEKLATDCTCRVRVVRHPSRFGAPLGDEFDATIFWMNYRNEDADVLEDIARLGRVYTDRELLGHPANMADTMCLSYTVTIKTKLFAMLWTSTVLDYSMREQLSFNVAINDADIGNDVCACADNTAYAINGVAYIQTEKLLG